MCVCVCVYVYIYRGIRRPPLVGGGKACEADLLSPPPLPPPQGAGNASEGGGGRTRHAICRRRLSPAGLQDGPIRPTTR